APMAPAPAAEPGGLVFEEPGFSPTPIDRTSPYRDDPEPDPAPRQTASVHAGYPPQYPSMGEPVPTGPSRVEPLTTASVAAAVTPAATLACPMVSQLDRWVVEGVQPAAQRWFRQPVVEIKQISAYSCRGMNGNPRARISEHAFGNALDIASFKLADGHVITIKGGWRGTPEEQGFLRDVQVSACQLFSTVLAPGSNVFHYDHIHVDLMRRSSGRQICQPAAVPGEVVAARARANGGYAARRPDFGATGALGSRPAPKRTAGAGSSRFDEDREMPTAVPGED
ncbi:extensin family protein, partial [Rhodoplanes sp. SY1]|uniref:extensin-like domain-containing protein n=1 Tax=Rhodoplanes sp. SY1 TaxID=3166646 RepID=UPI0038B48E18